MEKYKRLLEEVSKILEIHEYKKNGVTFYLHRENNFGLINFQKSKDSAENIMSFTINLSISSSVIRKFEEKDLNKKPKIAECHWQKRIGFLLSNKRDYWWKIDNNTQIDQLIAEITNVLIAIVLPEIQSHISDRAIETDFLSREVWLTDLQRYEYLTILLKSRNSDQFPQIVEEFKTFFKGKPHERNVEIHMEELLRKYGN